MEKPGKLWYVLAALQPLALLLVFPLLDILDSREFGMPIFTVFLLCWLTIAVVFTAMTAARSERKWYPFVTAILVAQPVYFVVFGLSALLQAFDFGGIVFGIFWVLGRGVTVIGMAADFWSVSDRSEWARAALIVAMAVLILVPLGGVLAALGYLVWRQTREHESAGQQPAVQPA